MIIILNFLLLLIGFVALIKGADFFVDGSSSLARTFKVPGVIIGLTIVAMGTSAPELAVSTSAAIKGSNEIALSNVLGSNIFNLLPVLGICALICPMMIDRTVLKRDFPFSIAISIALFVAISLKLFGKINIFGTSMEENVTTVTRPIGIALLTIFVIYMAVLIIMARKNKTEDDNNGKILPVWKSIIFIIVGLACIIIGGQLVVENAKVIAAAFGMSETLIGLTVVAVGTSLPELVTSIVASKKGENGLAVGNVVGSNIFNLLLILGISATINPISVNYASLIDFVIFILVSIMTFIFCATKKLSRVEGGIMVLIYIATVVFAIVR